MKEMTSHRLKYVPFTPDHLDNYFSLERDPEVMKHFPRKPSGTAEESLPFFNLYLTYMARNPKYGGFSVFDKVTGEFIGISVLMNIGLDEKNPDFELGYRIAMRHWNKRYGTEMALTMRDYGLYMCGLNEVFGTINPENVISARILKTIGLTRIGQSPFSPGCDLYNLKIEHV